MASSPDSRARMAIRARIAEKVEKQKALEEKLLLNLEQKKVDRANIFCGKCSKNKNKCKCGRPLRLEREPGKLELLREAFKLGSSDTESCAYAGISLDTLQNYCKKHPEFAVEKEKLKLLPILKAKANVVGAIAAGDLGQSNWYLERRARKEFSTRVENEMSGELVTGVVVLPALAHEGGELETRAGIVDLPALED